MSNFIKLSVSKTATFQSCKAKYKFAYIQKLPRKEWEYHLFGRFVHRVLELFHLSFINGSNNSYNEEMSNSFNTALEEFKNKLNLTAKDEAFQILSIYLKKINKEEIAKVLDVEKTFNLIINEGLTLTGMIDRVQLDEDGIYHIIDYKTSKSSAYLKNDVLQLLTYAYVIYMEHPELTKVRVSYIMLRQNCEFITKEFDLKEILSVKNIYEKYAEEMLNEEEFKPKPQVLCRFCDYSNVCEEGKEFISKQYIAGPIKYTKKM